MRCSHLCTYFFHYIKTAISNFSLKRKVFAKRLCEVWSERTQRFPEINLLFLDLHKCFHQPKEIFFVPPNTHMKPAGKGLYLIHKKICTGRLGKCYNSNKLSWSRGKHNSRETNVHYLVQNCIK